MSKPTKLFSLCSLLMAFMFAYSAAVQLNDPDWYLWFPLYACACFVNAMNWKNRCNAIVRHIGKVASWLGIFLFVKVVMEDFVKGIAGFWSLDLSERVVREKIGSGLVIISMVLHLKASSGSGKKTDRRHSKKNELTRFVECGMAVMVGFIYGLPFVFFVLQEGEMKF